MMALGIAFFAFLMSPMNFTVLPWAFSAEPTIAPGMPFFGSAFKTPPRAIPLGLPFFAVTLIFGRFDIAISYLVGCSEAGEAEGK